MFGFDFGKYLHELAETLSSSVIYQVSSCEKGEEIDEFKKKWMKKTSLINYTLPQNKREVKI